MTTTYCLYLGCATFAFLFMGGAAIFALCEAADERKKKGRLDEMDRERREAEASQPEDVTLVDDDEQLPTPLHRLAEMHFRYMACGHSVYEFCAWKGQCLQCILEGRVASRDMGRR